MSDQETVDRWNKAAKKLEGLTITQCQYLPVSDSDDEHALVIVLSDGTQLIPLQDDEGNGFGAVEVQGREDDLTMLPTMR